MGGFLRIVWPSFKTTENLTLDVFNLVSWPTYSHIGSSKQGSNPGYSNGFVLRVMRWLHVLVDGCRSTRTQEQTEGSCNKCDHDLCMICVC